MKKKKENQKVKSTRNGVFTLEDLKKVVEEVVVPAHHNLELAMDTKIENRARMMAESLKAIDGKIMTMDQRVILVREEILRKIDGTNSRVDDLAFNRVKYTDFDPVKKDVEALKTKFESKRVHGR